MGMVKYRDINFYKTPFDMGIRKSLKRISKEIEAIEFPTQEAMDKYLKKHPGADRRNHSVEKGELSPQEKESVFKYSQGETSYTLNRLLRNGKKLSEKQIRIFKNLVDALKKCPKYTGIVYRGVSNKKLFKDILANKSAKITFKSFVSSSRNKRETKDFLWDNHNVLFKIVSKDGRDITKYTDFYQDEKEVLFMPNSSFRITKKELVKDKMLIVDMIEI